MSNAVKATNQHIAELKRLLDRPSLSDKARFRLADALASALATLKALGG